ncbi:MAG: MFS transporter [Bdellovibrionales bacterium]|nr:MFS transporter [Bdellovibrionales bacterium]
MFGYSIKEITSVAIEDLVLNYNITMDKFIAQSILIGILPLASIIGAIITRVLIKKFKRLSGIYVFTIFNVGAIVLVNITTFYTLLIGRFIEGICVGFYSAIAPIYLKEIAPKELRKMLGLFFSFGKILGVLISIFIQLIVV